MKIDDIVFDHEAPYVKHRAMGKGVTYTQDGVLFSSGYVAIKVLEKRQPKDPFDDMNADQLRAALRSKPGAKKKPVQAQASAVRSDPRQTADDKLAGFKGVENPDYIRAALDENHAAAMAEERAG